MEELSLRDIIEIMLKGKWVIAIVTAVCVIFAGVYSFALLDEQYQAETMLTVPTASVGAYLEQIKAPEVLEHVRSEADFKGFTANQISEKIAVEAVKNTGLIKISVKDAYPQKAADMANMVSMGFVEFVSQTNKNQAKISAENIKTELEKEKVKLDDINAKLNEFLSLPGGPEELKLELNAKLTQLTQYKTQLIQAEVDEKLETVKLNKANELLENTPDYLDMNKAMPNDAYIALLQNINTFEINLANYQAKMLNLQESVVKGQSEIGSIQSELSKKQQTYDNLMQQYSLIKGTYDAYQQKYKEAMIKQSDEAAGSSITVASRAVTPEAPVGPSKMTNVAIGGMIGLLISTLIVFLREYWIRSGNSYRYNETDDDMVPIITNEPKRATVN